MKRSIFLALAVSMASCSQNHPVRVCADPTAPMDWQASEHPARTVAKCCGDDSADSETLFVIYAGAQPAARPDNSVFLQR